MNDKKETKRKDRLIQTRVPEDLEASLKQEAEAQRMTVSHLIRNMLEDAFDFAERIVSDVDKVVQESSQIADVVRDAARSFRHEEESADKEPSSDSEIDLSHIYGWNELVLHKAAQCGKCQDEINQGTKGFAGLSDDPSKPRAWLCGACIGRL